jgi:ADP-ribose pyrophosphatase YjhB (NUDIX family)
VITTIVITMTTNIISCGCCVIKYAGDVPQLLLVRPGYKNNAWGIPKGHLEKGETYEMCAYRETKEETGVKPVIIDFLIAVKTFSTKYNKIVYAFLAAPLNIDYVPYSVDGENYDVRYFPINELPNVHPYQISLMNKTISKIKSVPKDIFINKCQKLKK